MYLKKRILQWTWFWILVNMLMGGQMDGWISIFIWKAYIGPPKLNVPFNGSLVVNKGFSNKHLNFHLHFQTKFLSALSNIKWNIREEKSFFLLKGFPLNNSFWLLKYIVCLFVKWPQEKKKPYTWTNIDRPCYTLLYQMQASVDQKFVKLNTKKKKKK